MLKSAIKAAWHAAPFQVPLVKALRRLGPVPERLYRHMHFQGEFDVDVAPGARFRIRSYATWVENDLFWAGYAGNWERTSLDIWRRLCPGAETVLDVGANTGVYSLAAAALNPQARVIAFEPVPRVFERLKANVALNGSRVVVENIAVSDRDGVATLHDTDNEHEYSASLDHGMLGARYSRSYEVPTATLDNYCAAQGIGRVDLVKIDVERHEPSVFRGFQRRLAENRPTVLVEILDAEIGRAVTEQIAGLGYCIFGLPETGGGKAVFAVETLGQSARNYLLCQPETARRLGLPEGNSVT